MMISRQSRFTILALLPILTLLLGWQLGARAQQRQMETLQQQMEYFLTGESTQSGTLLQDPEREVDLGLFWGVWRLLQTHYIAPDDLKAEPMLFGAVRGLVSAVGDPYTVFMPPKENKEFREGLSGHLQGIGAELGNIGEQVVVVSPLKGSPAEKAGLLPQDAIIEVNGEDITELSLQEVVSKIRGPKGSIVELTIVRESEDDLLTFKITRDDITVPSTEYEVKETGSGAVGYLAINQFGGETVAEVTEFLRSVRPAELKGLIVDLRFNGGGYLDGAVDLASMFLREGEVVTVAGRDESQTHSVSGDPVLPEIPLVVLINQASASASEIFAGALQDHGRATIVGMKSFGKGTVQEVLDLPGGSSLRVTIARWLTPKGRDLGKEGVVPDFVVDHTRQDIEAQRDPQLEAALQWLTEGKVDVKTGTGSERQ